MRHFSGIFMLTGAIVVALAITASAQMGMSNQTSNKMPMNQDNSSQMTKMANDSRMLMEEYTKIEADFDRIMAMQDQTAMKNEMAKHRKMLAAFQQKLQHHQEMYQMLEKSQYGNMQQNMGMMSTKTTDDSKTTKKANTK